LCHFGRADDDGDRVDPSRDRVTYLGALVCDHSHGGSADVAGSHAADLNIPFFSHVAMLYFGR
jgi:hypothetical protein